MLNRRGVIVPCNMENFAMKPLENAERKLFRKKIFTMVIILIEYHYFCNFRVGDVKSC